MGPSGAQPPFVWIDQAAADVGNNKIVYLSPQYYGLDVGVQYAPSEGNAFAELGGRQPFAEHNLQPGRGELHQRHLRQRCYPLL